MPHLLCIDDCPDLLRVLAHSLRENGYAVTTCLTAAEALTKLVNQPFDAVVTDLNMPPHNGLEFACLARACGFKHSIIMLTGNDNVTLQDNSNIDAIVMKGLPPSILLNTLQHHLLAAPDVDRPRFRSDNPGS